MPPKVVHTKTNTAGNPNKTRYHLHDDPEVTPSKSHVNHMSSYVNESHPMAHYSSALILSSSKSLCSGKTEADSTIMSARSSRSSELSDDDGQLVQHRRVKSTSGTSPSSDVVSSIKSRLQPGSMKGALRRSKSAGTAAVTTNVAMPTKYRNELSLGSDELEFLDQLVLSVSLQSSPDERKKKVFAENFSSRDKLTTSPISNRSTNDLIPLNESIESNTSTSVGDISGSESALKRRMERHNYLMNLATNTNQEGKEMKDSSKNQSRSRSLSRRRSRVSSRSRSRPRQQFDIESIVAMTILNTSSENDHGRSLSRSRRSSSRSRTRGRRGSMDPDKSFHSSGRSKSRTRLVSEKNMSTSETRVRDEINSNSVSSPSAHIESKSLNNQFCPTFKDDNKSFQGIAEQSSQKCGEASGEPAPHCTTTLTKNRDKNTGTSTSTRSQITGNQDSGVVIIQKNGVVMVKRVGSKNKESQEPFKTSRKVGESSTHKLVSLRQAQTRGRSRGRRRHLLKDDEDG